jgi:hypothetical protein
VTSLTHRDDLLRDQLAHLPYGTRRATDAGAPVRVGATGTGDSLLVLFWSAAELARERAAGVRVLSALGVRPDMRVANTLPGALATPGALLLGDVVEELGALDVPLGTIDGPSAARAAWELFDRVHPEVVVLADGAFLASVPAGSRPWWRMIVWLRSGRVAATPAPHAGFTGVERTWLAVPEATSFVAGSCAAGRFHADERVVVEIADPESGAPCPEGFLVVTPLDVETAVARYATGLTGRIVPGTCPCGGRGVVLEVR